VRVDTAWIAGATGLVGGHCLKRLLEYCPTVVSIGRRGTELSHPRLLERTTSFEDLASLDAPAPDALFCTLGATLAKAGSQEAFRRVDCDYVVRFAEEGLRRGARQFLVVSSVDAEPWCPVYYLKVKAEMEAKVTTLGYRSVHVFRPSFLFGQRLESRPAEALGIVAAKLLHPVMVGSLSKYRGIDAADVASAMVTAARRGESGIHRYHWQEMMSMARAPWKAEVAVAGQRPAGGKQEA
jgi:uncharacterized protein YbjT (DUF2867 family)